jgi:hypothetical protein
MISLQGFVQCTRNDPHILLPRRPTAQRYRVVDTVPSSSYIRRDQQYSYRRNRAPRERQLAHSRRLRSICSGSTHHGVRNADE